MIGSNLNGAATVGAPGALRGIQFESELSLKRLLPRIEPVWQAAGTDAKVQHEFETRLQEHWLPLFVLLRELYGDRYC